MYLSNKNEDYNYLELKKYKEAINVYKLKVDKDEEKKKIIMIS